MIKFKRFWFDLMHPKQWSVYHFISNFIWKLKDYDRLEHDYCYVLYFATYGQMSKSNYDTQTICAVIDNEQSKFYYDIIKKDINNMINNGTTITEIQEYINNL